MRTDSLERQLADFPAVLGSGDGERVTIARRAALALVAPMDRVLFWIVDRLPLLRRRSRLQRLSREKPSRQARQLILVFSDVGARNR